MALSMPVAGGPRSTCVRCLSLTRLHLPYFRFISLHIIELFTYPYSSLFNGIIQCCEQCQSRWLHSGDIGSHDAWLCQMGFHRATSIESSIWVANCVAIGVTKASKRSRCPLMPPLKVHQYRGKLRGRDCTYKHKIHSTAWQVSFSWATACRQILWSDSPWTGREIEPAWEN